jgi:hypothetical protein
VNVTAHTSEDAAGTEVLSHSGIGTFARKQKSFTVNAVVGVEAGEAPAWGVYPNPASGTAVAVLPAGWEGATVAVRDASGRTVATPPAVAGRVELDAAGLVPGIYFVQAVRDGAVSVIRWSVQ